jgi:hypothetical protein
LYVCVDLCSLIREKEKRKGKRRRAGEGRRDRAKEADVVNNISRGEGVVNGQF